VHVLVEHGRTKTFASALDWPGWARSAKGAHDALEMLEAYRSRYAGVLTAHSVSAPEGRLLVVATVPGDATTDFGAPSQVCDADRRALRNPDRARLAAILRACWAGLDDAVARTGSLRPGPRGGGRSVSKIAEHVSGAEIAYARKLGLRIVASQGDDRTDALRARILAVLDGTQPADRDGAWPLRYGVRRIAWHACDHLFEIEDRMTS